MGTIRVNNENMLDMRCILIVKLADETISAFFHVSSFCGREREGAREHGQCWQSASDLAAASMTTFAGTFFAKRQALADFFRSIFQIFQSVE